jgi:hypothetical protein
MSEPNFITDQLQHVVAYNQNGRIIHTQPSKTTRIPIKPRELHDEAIGEKLGRFTRIREIDLYG